MPIVYEKNAFSTPFLSGYKVLKIPLILPDGTSSWPELFSLSRIQQMRDAVGVRHFSAQMMLEFISPERACLDPGGIDFYEYEFEPRNCRLGEFQVTGMTLYWDPSTGRQHRDSSACVLLYRDDATRHIFIHDILYLTVPESEQFPLSYQCDKILDFMHARNLSRISLETNGLGMGLPEIMRDCALRRGIKIHVNKIRNNQTKTDRILNSIEPFLSTGRLHAHTRTQHTPLLSEMLGWSPVGSRGAHDDGLDAVAGAISDVPIPVRPTGGVIKTYSAKTNFSI